MGTYHGLNLKSVTEGVANPHQEQAVKQGRSLFLVTSVTVVILVTKPAPVIKQQPVSKESRVPIIIVPATASSALTIYNAVEFLQDQKWVALLLANKVIGSKGT